MPLFSLGDDGNIGYSSISTSVDQVTPVPSRTDPGRSKRSQPIPKYYNIVPNTLPYRTSPSQPHFNFTVPYRTRFLYSRKVPHCTVLGTGKIYCKCPFAPPRLRCGVKAVVVTAFINGISNGPCIVNGPSFPSC